MTRIAGGATLLALIFCLPLVGQNGDTYFENKDYYNASQNYQREALSDPSRYLNLAKSYFALKDFKKAAEAMEKYKSEYDQADKAIADEWLELLQRNDDPVEVTNMGNVINTGHPDFFPCISRDGNTLYFLTKDRDEGLGGEDIWFVLKRDDGSWSNPVNFRQLNTSSHESLQSISGDGNFAIVFGNYKGSFGHGDLFYSVKTDEGWSMPCNLGGAINTSNWESQANLAADGRTLLFCSNRPGGQGYSDIYVSKLEENGWTTPINLGPTINTANSDISPYLASDGKTLYFSSSGHGGFGGSDLLMSKRLDDSWTNWSEPVNLGKYINTLQDDEYMAVSSAGNLGYTVKDGSPDGYGEEDLYQFLLPMNMRPEAVFNVWGVVTNEADSAAGVVLRYIDMENNTEVAKASSDFNKGEYRVSLAPKKKYLVKIDMKGYLYSEEVLDLTDPKLYMSDETIQDKMVEEIPEIKALRTEYAHHLKVMDTLMTSQNHNIQGGFENWKELYTNMINTSNELEDEVNKARFRWMSEEDNNWTMQKDYTVQRIKIGSKFELENIFFDLGKATLSSDSKESLEELVDIMKHSDIVIELGGHTDSIGEEDNNLKLSQDRVNSVRDFLISNEIDENRITAIGYGESQPLASNSTDEGRKKNRRVEVKITEIAPREGAGEYEKQEAKKKEETKQLTPLDLLYELQSAAKAGGLPKGSECSNEVTYLPTGRDPIVYKDDVNNMNQQNQDKPKKSNNFQSLDNLSIDENVFKSFNIHMMNKGYDFDEGEMLGVGMIFTRSKNLREIHLDGFFVGSDSTQWGARLGFRWFAQTNEYTGIPLSILLGLDLNVLSLRPSIIAGDNPTKSLTGDDEVLFYADLPLGLRYTLDLASVILAPELHYAFNIYALQSDDLDAKLKAGRFSVGANARWKFLNAGLFFNTGKVEDYLGWRVGLSF